MNDFESERAAKAARFRQLAEKHANIATGRHFAARERLEVIPLGQPILVGHRSEKRHRKDLTRLDEHFAKAKEHHDKAEYFRRRAAAAESNVIIFSDDPDATEKLVDKIERLKKRQGVMKRANHLIRKADREGLADLGFSEESIAKLFAQDFAGRSGFPNYTLANNSANIRRLEKRLAVIQNAQHDETTEAGGQTTAIPTWRYTPALAVLTITRRRLALTQIDFRRPTSEPLETFMIEIAISCDMSQYLKYK
jgi:Domain of unknown function (DUF3560)